MKRVDAPMPIPLSDGVRNGPGSGNLKEVEESVELPMHPGILDPIARLARDAWSSLGRLLQGWHVDSEPAQAAAPMQGSVFFPQKSIRAEVDFLSALLVMLQRMYERDPELYQRYRSDSETVARLYVEPWDLFWGQCEERLRYRVMLATSTIAHSRSNPAPIEIGRFGVIHTDIAHELVAQNVPQMRQAFLRIFSELRTLGLDEEASRRWSFYIACLVTSMTRPENDRYVARRRHASAVQLFGIRDEAGEYNDIPVDFITMVKRFWAFGQGDPHMMAREHGYRRPAGADVPSKKRMQSDFAYEPMEIGPDGKVRTRKPSNPGAIFETPLPLDIVPPPSRGTGSGKGGGSAGGSSNINSFYAPQPGMLPFAGLSMFRTTAPSMLNASLLLSIHG